VRTFIALDRKGEVGFVPLQSPYGRKLAFGAGLDPDAPQSFVFFDKGQALQKSAAILALLDRLPAPWRWGRIIAVLPRGFRDRAYDLLANNRYRLFGKRKICMTPSDRVRARFITEPPTP
jgi:predicted DCC family thiol-disulfide oxidoreductase YuxK